MADDREGQFSKDRPNQGLESHRVFKMNLKKKWGQGNDGADDDDGDDDDRDDGDDRDDDDDGDDDRNNDR